MAGSSTSAHVDSPYHYSFSVCAGAGRQQNLQQYGPGPKYRNSYYDEYLESRSEYYCDLCDRGFRSDPQLQSHLAEHVTCGREGCKFTAHSKLVDQHVRVQHATGIFSRLKKLDNPQEVQKWLEERRKKYPTRKIVANKDKLEDAMKKRGETIKQSKSLFNKDFGPRGGGGRGRGRGRERGRGRGRRSIRPNHVKPVLFEEKKVYAINGTIPAFQGVLSIVKEEEMPEPQIENLISDDEETKDYSNLKVEKVETSSLTNKSLGLLMSAYDSDASEDETSTQPALTQPQSNQDEDKPDEFKSNVPAHPPIEDTTSVVYPRKRQQNKRKPADFVKNQPIRPKKRKPTLWHNLISSEIKRERNVIRQCVRHVVRNNFYQNHKPENQKSKNSWLTKKLPAGKTKLVQGLLKNEIVHERNVIMQCVRHVVNHNYFNP